MTLTDFQKLKQKERELIIEIGGNLFLRKGFQGFSLRELTDKLNLPKSNFYSHFSSKRELFYAFKVQEYQRFYEKLHAYINQLSGPTIDKLLRIAQFFLDHAAGNFAQFQLIFATTAPLAKKIGPIEREFNSRPNIVMREFIELLQNAMEAGVLKPVDPLNCTYFLWAMLYGNIQTINRIKTGNLGDHKAYESYALGEIRRYFSLLQPEKRGFGKNVDI